MNLLDQSAALIQKRSERSRGFVLSGVGGADNLYFFIELRNRAAQRVVELFLGKNSAEVHQLARKAVKLSAYALTEFFQLSALRFGIVIIFDLRAIFSACHGLNFTLKALPMSSTALWTLPPE